MSWFAQAKYGLSITWGLYAIPAGEWKGQLIPGPGEWIMHNANIPISEYGKLAAQFNPTNFDAEAWVKFAENAGMKYIVITAKHHDGFAMYHSATSKYNVLDATPFHRDPLKELADACARHNIKLGFYYSLSKDWHAPKDFDQYLRTKAEPQVKELLTGYGPICLLWFDAPPSQRIVDIANALQPATVIDGSKGGWLVPATVNRTWGYKKDDSHWKSEDELTFDLVDLVSKGSNYLINVGPTADGIIPRPSMLNLQSAGEWLRVNGEAIYGAIPCDGGMGDKIRCTAKPGKLFMTLFQWPSGQLELNQIKNRVINAYLLADPTHAPLKFTQTGTHLAIVLPKDPLLEGPIPDRVPPQFAIAASHTHVRSVVVLEIRTSRGS